MNVKGLWKIKEAEMFTVSDEGVKYVWRTVEDIMGDESLEEDNYIKEMLPAEFLIDDNEIKILFPLPDDLSKEEIEQAVADGEFTLYGEDKTLIESYPIKQEDGKLWYESGEKGEVFGEPVSPWKEIPVTEDGIQFTGYRLIRADESFSEK